MSAFSEAERTYLAEGKLGRLATIDPAGFPHVVPVGWQHNAELDTIDIGGRNPEATQVPQRAATAQSRVRGRRRPPAVEATVRHDSRDRRGDPGRHERPR